MRSRVHMFAFSGLFSYCRRVTLAWMLSPLCLAVSLLKQCRWLPGSVARYSIIPFTHELLLSINLLHLHWYSDRFIFLGVKKVKTTDKLLRKVDFLLQYVLMCLCSAIREPDGAEWLGIGALTGRRALKQNTIKLCAGSNWTQRDVHRRKYKDM